MDNIKLRNKSTGNVLDCDIYLNNIPQCVEVEIKDGEGYGYFSLDDLAKNWEIVPNEELRETEDGE